LIKRSQRCDPKNPAAPVMSILFIVYTCRFTGNKNSYNYWVCFFKQTAFDVPSLIKVFYLHFKTFFENFSACPNGLGIEFFTQIGQLQLVWIPLSFLKTNPFAPEPRFQERPFPKAITGVPQA
jgi:hypothetical protein